jgi:hypothetical protein
MSTFSQLNFKHGAANLSKNYFNAEKMKYISHKRGNWE